MKNPPPNHLPPIINAETMVIKSQRGHWRWVLDCLLTVCAWISFFYLFTKGILSIATGQHNGVSLPFFTQLLPTLSDLSTYILAMLLQGGFLLLWARYNYFRFRGKKRRSPFSQLTDVQLKADYDINAHTLQQLRSQPISVIHHAQDGRILKTTHPYQPIPHQPLIVSPTDEDCVVVA